MTQSEFRHLKVGDAIIVGNAPVSVTAVSLTGDAVTVRNAHDIETVVPIAHAHLFAKQDASMKPKKLLTSAQYNALADFSAYNGRTWKSVLRHAWMTGHYPSITKDTASLQQIRNTFGPSWLTRFRFCPACFTDSIHHSQICNK